MPELSRIRAKPGQVSCLCVRMRVRACVPAELLYELTLESVQRCIDMSIFSWLAV